MQNSNIYINIDRSGMDKNMLEVDIVAKARHMYPGGNTCYGFYSFYDYIVPPDAYKKIILKGGPGTGKSTFMKSIADDFIKSGFNIEYHWCSSDNNSLDGIVIGDSGVCILDGTAPHVVDPRYPGAVDYIINAGDFWDAESITAHKQDIIGLTQQIGLYFQRAYNRLKESNSAWWEYGSFISGAVNPSTVNRNILALTDDFIHGIPKSSRPPRHLFAGAITPGGVVTKIETLIDNTWSIFAIKGSPSSGVKNLLQHTAKVIELNSIYAEIYHSPFDPNNLDLILIPANKSALVDLSGHIVDYENSLAQRQYKRILDFDQLLDPAPLKANAGAIEAAAQRFRQGLGEAIVFIQQAKQLHDDLEKFYVPAMNFTALKEYGQTLCGELLQDLKKAQA